MSLWCTRTGFGIIMLNSMNTAVFSPALVTRRRDRPSGASVSMAIPIANCTLQSNTSLRIRMWYNRHREGFLHLQDKLQLHVDILVQRPTDISLHHRCRGALSGLWMMTPCSILLRHRSAFRGWNNRRAGSTSVQSHRCLTGK